MIRATGVREDEGETDNFKTEKIRVESMEEDLQERLRGGVDYL